jgi:hypothetical protein
VPGSRSRDGPTSSAPPASAREREPPLSARSRPWARSVSSSQASVPVFNVAMRMGSAARTPETPNPAAANRTVYRVPYWELAYGLKLRARHMRICQCSGGTFRRPDSLTLNHGNAIGSTQVVGLAQGCNSTATPRRGNTWPGPTLFSLRSASALRSTATCRRNSNGRRNSCVLGAGRRFWSAGTWFLFCHPIARNCIEFTDSLHEPSPRLFLGG